MGERLMGLIGILCYPKWWWNHRWYTLRSERQPNTTELEKTVEYDTGDKRHYYGLYWHYRDPETGLEYKERMMGTTDMEWTDDDFKHHVGWVSKQYGPEWEGEIIDNRDEGQPWNNRVFKNGEGPGSD